jgi:hypothetical protein
MITFLSILTSLLGFLDCTAKERHGREPCFWME